MWLCLLKNANNSMTTGDWLGSVFLRRCFFLFGLGLFLLGFSLFLALHHLVAEIAHVLETRPNPRRFLILGWDVLDEVGSEHQIVHALTHFASVSQEPINEPNNDENGAQRKEND